MLGTSKSSSKCEGALYDGAHTKHSASLFTTLPLSSLSAYTETPGLSREGLVRAFLSMCTASWRCIALYIPGKWSGFFKTSMDNLSPSLSF